jgi:hypothetical protein
VSSPPVGTSFAIGVRAAAQELWLLPVAALVAFVRSAAMVPALAVGIALPLEAAALAMRLRPYSLTAPFEGALAVASSVRYATIVAALALAGAALSGLLRVLFLSGALPTLGARLAGNQEPRSFAAGIAWGLPRQLGTWILAALAEVAAIGYLLAALAGTLLAAAGSLSTDHPLLLAAFGALALAIGVAGLVVVRVLGDAAAARAAILGENPAAAFAGAVRRYLARPGGFTLGGLAFVLASVAVGSILQPATGIVGQLSERLDIAVALGPQLMLAVVAALAGAAVELGWLGTVSAMACAEVQDAPRVSA